MLKLKSDASITLQSLCSMIETQFKCITETIRSDNGGIFEVKQFYSQKGVIHHKTCVDTSQPNAIAKRKHQHILNLARALRFQSNIH